MAEHHNVNRKLPLEEIANLTLEEMQDTIAYPLEDDQNHRRWVSRPLVWAFMRNPETAARADIEDAIKAFAEKFPKSVVADFYFYFKDSKTQRQDFLKEFENRQTGTQSKDPRHDDIFERVYSLMEGERTHNLSEIQRRLPDKPLPGATAGVDPLATLADELLIQEGFLRNVIELLRDKGQVIFYGPPGTGKTFVARKLMEHLAPEVSRQEVVQFHPSYSYEDFVHGYRPATRGNGALYYELKPGPLMRLAHQATDSDSEHVLLIDEINRGNLPKILGELLYLLEYRNDEVVLMYGEEEARFSLPENLLIIGTMNTADRSIALIDAALRRRFHFVPFFPNDPPLDGLLRRWLERHSPRLAYDVASVVDRLNVELRERFGPHLQVGPSYFMKKNLDEATLGRVWDYDVMPFLEDQLFGQEEELKRFTLDNLRERENADDHT